MRLKKISTIALLVIVLVSTIACCTKYPEGSVISQEFTWLDEHYQDYQKIDVAVTVQNIGGAGLIGMRVYCTPNASDSTSQVLVSEETGQTMEQGSIYLEEGEQGTLHFYFWAQGQINCYVQFLAYE